MAEKLNVVLLSRCIAELNGLESKLCIQLKRSNETDLIPLAQQACKDLRMCFRRLIAKRRSEASAHRL